MLKECRRNRQCAHCGRLSHHRSLCPQLFGSGDHSYNVLPEVQKVVSTEAQTISGVVDEEKVMLTSTKQVLMQTATSIIKNIPGDILTYSPYDIGFWKPENIFNRATSKRSPSLLKSS